MPTLQTKPAELEPEFDANFTGEAWTEQAVVDEPIREIGGADIREIDWGSPPRSWP